MVIILTVVCYLIFHLKLTYFTNIYNILQIHDGMHISVEINLKYGRFYFTINIFLTNFKDSMSNYEITCTD